MEDSESAFEPIIKGEITKIRAALKYGDSREKLEALHALIKLKDRGRELVPIILEAHSRGEPWVTDPSLVELLEATSDQSIFRYLRESHHFPQLGIGEKIKLFRLCVHELESELIKFLYENRNTMEPWRRDVVDALGEFGGKESLEAIKAMLSELSELGAPPNTADAPTPASILDHFVRSAQFQFREKLRSARDRLQHRGID